MRFVQVKLFILLLLVCLPFSMMAQSYKQKNLDYINKYKDYAIESMNDYKIPASITLAQGILESGSGQSTLAKKGNNHFGIKCGRNWKGRKSYHDDDARGECFRNYRSAKESYDDHSIFLANGPRYAFLFDLDITDYKGWARGLKKAGYATDPSYANRLISLIEEYELYQYDSGASRGWFRVRKSKAAAEAENAPIIKHQVYLSNDLAYVVARRGDTFKTIGKEFDLSWKKLVKYNDLHKSYTLTEGDIVYLRSKRKKASKQYKVYTVENGDSMHSISQKFGIKLKNLYKMNRKDPDFVPEVGDPLRLR